MNYHVFIVDKNTFKYHLEYMFAGTGAADKEVPFLIDSNAYTHYSTERNLVGMIADVSRIRIGDKIIFYLQATDKKPGIFYGVFKATSTAFFDENDNNNFLKNELQKSLTFRIKIEPDLVYPIGVSEHDYLDSLQDINYPFQMCWSLIYRKLKGNRGCTMITDYEYERLISKLKSVNKTTLKDEISSLTFNNTSYSIESTKVQKKIYTGRINSINIINRMLYKANRNNAFEVHLQAFIMQHFDSPILRDLLLPFPDQYCWIGNEVSCGVGMQRIDIMIKQEKGNNVFIKVVELKYTEPNRGIFDDQLHWYVRWIIEYVAPNYTILGKKVKIIPCVIAAKTTETGFIGGCKTFQKAYNSISNTTVTPVEYISFNINSNEIIFNKN